MSSFAVWANNEKKGTGDLHLEQQAQRGGFLVNKHVWVSPLQAFVFLVSIKINPAFLNHESDAQEDNKMISGVPIAHCLSIGSSTV